MVVPVCMIWLHFPGVYICYGNVSCSGADGCGMSNVYMLKSVGEKYCLEGCLF